MLNNVVHLDLCRLKVYKPNSVLLSRWAKLAKSAKGIITIYDAVASTFRRLMDRNLPAILPEDYWQMFCAWMKEIVEKPSVVGGIMENWSIFKINFFHDIISSTCCLVTCEILTKKNHHVPLFGQFGVVFFIHRNIRGILRRYTYRRWVSNMNHSLKHIITHRWMMYTFHMSLLMCENTWKSQFKCRSSFFTAQRTSVYRFWQDFRRSGAVNGLVRRVSVPRHFLNDTNTLYITNAMYTNT